jgi:hypothetical protein
MTGLVAVAFGVGAVAVLALAGAVVGLRSRVESLSRRVDGAVALPGPDPQPGRPARATAPAARADRAAATDVVSAATVEVPVDEPVTTPTNSPSVGHPVPLITAMTPEAAAAVEPGVTRVVSVTLAGPLIKVAALSHGVRHALREESRMRIGYAVRRELKRQRKLRRRRPAAGAPAQGRRS